MKRQQGFTLIEIMLVLVVISMSAMVVVMSLPNRSQDAVRTVVDSLYQRVSLLSDQAVFSGQSYGVYVDDAEHQIILLMLTEKGWQPLKSKSMKETIKLDDSLDMKLDIGGGIWNNSERLFKPGKLFDDLDFGEEKEKKNYNPQIILFNSGDISAFSLSIWSKDTPDETWVVGIDKSGQLLIKTPQEVASAES